MTFDSRPARRFEDIETGLAWNDQFNWFDPPPNPSPLLTASSEFTPNNQSNRQFNQYARRGFIKALHKIKAFALPSRRHVDAALGRETALKLRSAWPGEGPLKVGVTGTHPAPTLPPGEERRRGLRDAAPDATPTPLG